MKEKEFKKSKTGSVRVEPDALNEAKRISKEKGQLLTFYVTEAIKYYNRKNSPSSYSK